MTEGREWFTRLLNPPHSGSPPGDAGESARRVRNKILAAVDHDDALALQQAVVCSASPAQRAHSLNLWPTDA
jgi:hypothetical protein